jgi:hypothetical protein
MTGKTAGMTRGAAGMTRAWCFFPIILFFSVIPAEAGIQIIQKSSLHNDICSPIHPRLMMLNPLKIELDFAFFLVPQFSHKEDGISVKL